MLDRAGGADETGGGPSSGDGGAPSSGGAEGGGGTPEGGGGGGGEGGTGGSASGGQGAGGGSPAPACLNILTDNISTNHGHVVTVPTADVEAETEKTYQLTGAAHTHSLVISTSQFQALKANGSLVLETSEDSGHSHDVTLVCES